VIKTVKQACRFNTIVHDCRMIRDDLFADSAP